MSKQNNFRLSKTKNNILYILSGVSLALFAGLMLFPTINETTHAEGDEPDDGISIVVSDSISADVTLYDEGDYKIAKDTVTVSSSAPYGYELFLTADSEAHQSIYLNDDPTSSSVISPVSGTIAEPATLANNTWGFAIAGQGNFDDNYDPANPDPASKFAIIPTVDDQQAVFENNAATAEDNIDFYYGIKVEPTLEVGEYTTSAEYTAIAFTGPLAPKAILGDNGNLNFVYDRNVYAVGDTYTDDVGETAITNVYEIPMNSVECTSSTQMPWYSQRYTITKVNIDASFAKTRPTGTCGWFIGLQNATGIKNPQNLNTSNVTDMSYMFWGFGGSKSSLVFQLNLKDWNTSNVVNMSNMFSYCGSNAYSWFLIGLSRWDTSNVTDMSFMFFHAGYGANSWYVDDLTYWKTSNVVNMEAMFYDAGYNASSWSVTTNLDLRRWNVEKVTNHDNFIELNLYNSNASVVNNQPNWPN